MTQTESPAGKNAESTRAQNIGIWIFVLTNSFCADEMVPGWGLLHLHWPVIDFYLISIIGGGIGGALYGRRFFLPGFIGGAIAGAGALFSVGRYLAAVNTSFSLIIALVALVGSVPGFLVGYLLRLAQNRLLPAK